MADIQSYLNLITSQHRPKPNFMATVSSMLSHADDTTTCAAGLNDAFDIDQAVGAQLDILGQILGVSRVVNFQPTDAFGPVSGTFTRASVAYDYLTGAQVLSGVPRYDAAMFNQGIMFEETTVNLLSANQSHPTSGTTGFTTTSAHLQAGSSISQVATPSWVGGGSLQVVCDGTHPTQGVATVGISASLYTLYSCSVRVKAPAGATLSVNLQDATNNYYGQTNIIASGNWDTVKVQGMSTGPLPVSSLQIIVTTGVTPQAITFNLDGLQIEQKYYATSWMLGGVTRAAETLAIPTAGVFTPGNWAVEMVVTAPTSAGGNRYLWGCWIDANNRYALYFDWASSYLALLVESGGISYVIEDTITLTPGAEYRVMVSGDGSHIRLCKEGVQIGSDTAYVEPVGTLPANMYIGSDPNGVQQINGIIDDLRVSSRARTLVEHQAYVNGGVAQVVDSVTTFLLPFDGSVSYYVSTSPILDDATYQLVLKARIAQNMWDGTTPGIYTLFASLFPGSVYLILTDNQNMTCDVLVIGLGSVLQQNLISNGYIIPRPEGVQYVYAYPVNPVFSYGMDNTIFRGYDGGYWTS